MDTSSKPQLYENTRYNFERNARKTITIYTKGIVTSEVHDLNEPLIIDACSDVYIDSFISNNIRKTENLAEIFILGVDEFNIQSVSNESKYNNKLIIPNTTGSRALSADNTITHRATKFNYVGTINPCTLTKLTVSLTDNGGIDSGSSVAPAKANKGVDGNSTNGGFWITFVIVAKE